MGDAKDARSCRASYIKKRSIIEKRKQDCYNKKVITLIKEHLRRNHNMSMKNLSTLCYMQKNGNYLMLHRTVKKHDVNKDKWIGVGGHFEEGESPEECVLREVKEETGYTLTSYQYRGLVTFVSGDGVTEYMSLFTADGFEGTPVDCDEGELAWVPIEKVWDLNIWEGDKIFFRLIDENIPFFSLKLVYDGHSRLVRASLNGKDMELFEILKEDGTKSGVVQERNVTHCQGSLHATAHIWIVQKRADGGYDILLQKRSATKDSYPGCYDISAAGHVAVREDILDTALRELSEELGIQATEEEVTSIGTHKVYEEEVFRGRAFKDYEWSHIYVYQKPVEIDKLLLQESEVEEVRFVDYHTCLEQIKKNTLPNCINLEEFLMLGTYLSCI